MIGSSLLEVAGDIVRTQKQLAKVELLCGERYKAWIRSHERAERLRQRIRDMRDHLRVGVRIFGDVGEEADTECSEGEM